VITAVDSSVLLDVLCGTAAQAERAGSALHAAMSGGRLVVCECVIAEIRPALSGKLFEEFLSDWQLGFVPSSFESAMLAGKHFEQYLSRGGRGGRIISDFFIGAHAKVHADRLLARDRGYLRDYFRGLKVVSP